MLPLLLAAFFISACSKQAIFETGKTFQRDQCVNEPTAEYWSCMNQANENFEDYQIQRRQLLED